MPGLFANSAVSYYRKGWHPLPVHRKSKEVIPRGYTGRDGSYPDDQSISIWMRKYPEANIAVRLPEDIIGIDVDAYGEKRGLETLETLEDEYGELPYSIMSTSRTDGSGIRMFRVPVDRFWKGVLGPGIETVTWYHRYAVCCPSIHPEGRKYLWINEETGEVISGPPDISLIPDLPEDWIEFVSRRDPGSRKDYGPVSRQEWSLDFGGGNPCAQMSGTIAHWAARLEDGAYNSMRDGVFAIAQDAVNGHTGGTIAMVTIRAGYLRTAHAHRPSDSKRKIVSEWDRAVDSALSISMAGDPQAITDPCREIESGEEFAPIRAGAMPISLIDVEPKDVEWLCKPFLPYKALTIIDGDPGQGKSMITHAIAAAASRGRDIFPLGESDGERINTLIVEAEDDVETILVRRLRAAGADMKRVFAMRMPVSKGKSKPLILPDGIGRLEAAARACGARLIIIDPITSFLNENVKTNVDSSVRIALQPLKEVAERLHACIILIRHLNKASGQGFKAMYRGGGSIAFSAIARSGMITGDIEGGGYGLGQVKCSWDEKWPTAMTYTIMQDRHGQPYISWGEESDITVDELADGPRKQKSDADPSAYDQLCEFLEEMFSEQDTWLAKDALAFIKQAGLTDRPGTVNRAKQDLGIKSVAKRNEQGQIVAQNWVRKLEAKTR